jgi:SAM-dependent methyltransferase
VGFGNGSLLKWALDKSATIAGIEINDELISEAKKFKIKLYSSLKNVESKSISVLTFMDVFEHLAINEINQTLIEAARVLKDNGYLVARFPNCQSPAGLVEQFGDVTHKTMLSAPIFCGKLKEHGFEITSIAGAIPSSEFPAGIKAKALVGIKKGVRKIIQLIYRLGFGTGKVLLSPSVVIIAKLN